MILGNLIGRSFQGTLGDRRRGYRRRSRFRPRLDGLEGRELKDGGISMIAGTISIEGTAATDSATIAYADPSHDVIAVTWNNTTVEFDRDDVVGVRFDGKDGFNAFTNLTDIRTTATGGDGFNLFVGNSGGDTFLGGDGFNFFWVGGGHNTLVGGNGTNYFLGVGGDDSVTVGDGLNIIVRSS